jgi:excisionase family DNA binding protein
MDGQLLIGAKKASATLGVSVRTIWRLVDNNKLRPVRIGRRVLFSQKTLHAFIRRLEEQTKPRPRA